MRTTYIIRTLLKRKTRRADSKTLRHSNIVDCFDRRRSDSHVDRFLLSVTAFDIRFHLREFAGWQTVPTCCADYSFAVER
jgi:hypothetical protein